MTNMETSAMTFRSADALREGWAETKSTPFLNRRCPRPPRATASVPQTRQRHSTEGDRP
jgi:hypothetical protein